MSKTHWKKLHNPDYLGAYALDPGQEPVYTIRSVQKETVTGSDGKKEECTVVRFSENVKPMILNVTNAKTIEKIYKTPFIEEWAGKKIKIYATEVKAFGDAVDALRIRPVEPKEGKKGPVSCSDCKSPILAYQDATPEQIAKHTAAKYGAPLCAGCAKIRTSESSKAAAEAEPVEHEPDDVVSVGPEVEVSDG